MFNYLLTMFIGVVFIMLGIFVIPKLDSDFPMIFVQVLFYIIGSIFIIIPFVVMLSKEDKTEKKDETKS